MTDTEMEKWRHRERWIENQLKKHGWSETELRRGERYRKSEEYIVVGVIWSLLILPLPLGLSLIVYGSYLRFRYQELGEEYLRERADLKRKFNHQNPDESPEDPSLRENRWRGRLPRTLS